MQQGGSAPGDLGGAKEIKGVRRHHEELCQPTQLEYRFAKGGIVVGDKHHYVEVRGERAIWTESAPRKDGAPRVRNALAGNA
jgi:hypothetical protein